MLRFLCCTPALALDLAVVDGNPIVAVVGHLVRVTSIMSSMIHRNVLTSEGVFAAELGMLFFTTTRP